MKSERHIRREIKRIKALLDAGDIKGVRYKAVLEAHYETLRWVVNKEGHNPRSQEIDAYIDDFS